MDMQGSTELARMLATLGVGGVLAGIIFLFYRKDVKQYTELWKMVADQLTTTIKENTASNVKLITLIEAQERNALRKSDIEELVDHKLTKFKQIVIDPRFK